MGNHDTHYPNHIFVDNHTSNVFQVFQVSKFFIAKMPSLTQKLVILKGGGSLWIIVIRSGVHYDLACGAEAGGFVLQQWLGVWTILAY